jgi:hypothetical protein
VSNDANFKPVERLFPFACRARVVVEGRDRLLRSRKHLLFVLVVPGLSAEARESVLKNYEPVPVIEGFSVAELEEHFGFPEARVIGFLKSSLASSILRELKESGYVNLRQPPGGQADTASVIPAEK